MDVIDLENDGSSPDSFVSIASHGATEILGGLVQATCCDYDSRISRALAITQLKRALAGHAYARGAIFGLRSGDRISEEVSRQLHEQLAAILSTIHDLSSQAWDELV